MLPVSGIDLRLRDPLGFDELRLLEGNGGPVVSVIELARAIATTSTGHAVDWEDLPATDLGAVALTIRQAWLGDAIRTDGHCSASGCGAVMDISFGIEGYLGHHRPRPYRGVKPTDNGSWLELEGASVRFRVPRLGDLAKALEAEDAERALRERCIDPPDVSGPMARRLDRALDALSPILEGEISGRCPHCESLVHFHFDPTLYSLQELRDASSRLYEDIYVLATRFGWAEAEILNLPRKRRALYASLIDEARLQA